MANLGQQLNDESLRRADRKTHLDSLFFSIDAGTTGDEWSRFQLLMPANILEAYVEHCMVRAAGAITTLHAVDSNSLREVGQLFVSSEGAGGVIRDVRISQPLAGFGIISAAPGNLWICVWPLVNVHVTRNDSIEILVPPSDDSGSPTGDYDCTITLRDVKYTKK